MSEETHATNYVKIWMILVSLLAVSIIGPMAEIQIVTLVTAFGVAVVKAYLVARHFMHLNVQPRYVVYLVCASLTLMVVFWAGVAPDVYRWEGANWQREHVIPESVGNFHEDVESDSHPDTHVQPH